MNKLNDSSYFNLALTNTIILTSEYSKADKDLVCRSLYNHNVDNTYGLLQKPGIDINLYLKDGDNVVGAILCNTFNYCLYIDVMWIDERYRGHGYGKELVYQAERISKEKGCTFSHTCTFSYQSPEFYKACGYVIFAILDEYPDNIKQYFLKKMFTKE